MNGVEYTIQTNGPTLPAFFYCIGETSFLLGAMG